MTEMVSKDNSGTEDIIIEQISADCIDEVIEFRDTTLSQWQNRVSIYNFDKGRYQQHLADFMTPNSFHLLARDRKSNKIVGMVENRMTTSFGLNKEADGLVPLVDRNHHLYDHIVDLLIDKQIEAMKAEGTSVFRVLDGPIMANHIDRYRARNFVHDDTVLGYVEVDLTTIEPDALGTTGLEFHTATEQDIVDINPVMSALGLSDAAQVVDQMQKIQQKGVVRALRIDNQLVALLGISKDDGQEPVDIGNYVINWEHEQVWNISREIFKELMTHAKELGASQLRISRRLNKKPIEYLKSVGFDHTERLGVYKISF